jgi:capsular polysaccharide biosynthesis protein
MIEPKVSLFHDLIALPHSAKKPNEKRRRWTALYDGQGRRVDETNIVVAPRMHRKFAAEYRKAPERIDVPEDLEVVEDDVLYIGVSRDHYGHFVLDSMSRMWAALDRDLPCIFLGTGKMAGEYYREIMGSMSFPVLTPDRPTLYRRIWVPSPSLTVDEISRNADAAHLVVTERLHPANGGRWEQPVFLSRRRLVSRARSLITNQVQEEKLEAALEMAGYRIVHPQELSFADQIALFNECPNIVGLIGSAFHTTLFSRRSWTAKLALLTFNHRKNSRYRLVDSIKGYSPRYIKCTDVNLSDKTMSIDVGKAIRRLDECGFLD